MKSDLDELERKARAVREGTDDPMDDGSALAISDPDVILALIARIRELESEVLRAAGLLEAGSDRRARREWAAGLRESVAKGVVLP